MHAFLFAIYPVLHLLSVNMQEFPLRVLWAPLGTATSLAGAVWSLLMGGLWLTRRSEIVDAGQLRRRAALFTTLLVVSVWTYGRLLSLPNMSELLAAFALAAVMVLLGVLTWRARGDLRRATFVLNSFAGALVVIVTAIILHFAILRADESWLVLKAPSKEASSPEAADTQHPAVFHVVLDAYGRSDTLASLYDFDNTAFIEWLEQQGFFIARESRANYSHTVVTLASMLNMDYLDELAAEVGPEAIDQQPLRRRIADSRARRLLEKEGYTFVSLDSGFWATSVSSAPIYVESGQQNEFNRALIAMTTASSAAAQRQADQERLRYAFRSLPELAARNERLFVLAHFLAPHPPFVFASDGRDTGEGRYYGQLSASHLITRDGITRDDYKRRFQDQLHWVNARLKETVTDILAAAKTPPIIIIHGDHGPGAYFSHERWEESYLHDRMSVLSAFLLPATGVDVDDQSFLRAGAASSAFVTPYSSISHINSYRLLFNRYFGADFVQLPDRSFYSTALRPYRFIDIQEEIDSTDDRARLGVLERDPYFPSAR